MYLETGLGQQFKPRPKAPAKPPIKAKPRPKAPADRFLDVYVYWDLKVPLRKDFEAFRQKVAEAIGRHVAANEKTRIDGLLLGGPNEKFLKDNHDFYWDRGKSESDFVTVRVSLRFRKNNHTDLDWLSIEVPPPSY